MTVSKVAEVLFELFADFDDEAAAAVVHGADDAGYVEVGVDGLADFADGGHKVGNALEGVVFAKHGGDDAVASDQQDVAHIQSHARLRAHNTLPVNYKESEIYA